MTTKHFVFRFPEITEHFRFCHFWTVFQCDQLHTDIWRVMFEIKSALTRRNFKGRSHAILASAAKKCLLAAKGRQK